MYGNEVLFGRAHELLCKECGGSAISPTKTVVEQEGRFTKITRKTVASDATSIPAHGFHTRMNFHCNECLHNWQLALCQVGSKVIAYMFDLDMGKS